MSKMDVNTAKWNKMDVKIWKSYNRMIGINRVTKGGWNDGRWKEGLQTNWNDIQAYISCNMGALELKHNII